MSVAVYACLIVTGVAVLLPAVALFVECVAALLCHGRAVEPASTRAPRLVVLIPAHNEEQSLSRSLVSLAPQLGPDDRIVVIADNCQDGTAEVARRWGVEAIAHRDTGQCGKGYALDYGLRYLAASPPEVVIMVDADDAIAPDGLRRIAHLAQSSGRPVQACCRFEADDTSTLSARLAHFATTVKNRVRPLGLHHLGLPCLLAGSGMAFPWQVIRAAEVASDRTADDVRLTAALALAGHLPLFCPEATVHAHLHTGGPAGARQRVLWAHGHLEALVQESPRLLWAAVRQRDRAVLALAVEIAIPPLGLLALIWSAGAAASLAAGAVGAGWLLASLFLLSGAPMLAAVAVAWHAFGREIVPLRAFLSLPGYVAARIPLYVSFIHRRQSTWRSGDTPPGQRKP